MTTVYSDPQLLADDLVDQLKGDIVLGLPLGLGKACHLANALVARALADPSVKLRIFSALTLEPPSPKSDLERRFLDPVIARTMGGYPKLAYADLQRRDALPPNITVDEFFFQAGTRLTNQSAQRSYIAANYTHAASYLLDRGVNLLAQLVARREDRISLSCNTDITLDLLAAKRRGLTKFLLAAQVSEELPFMPGEGDLAMEACSHILEGPAVQFPLFGPPKEPITDAHYAIGFHAAGLVRDGGTVQMGIGSTSDAVAQALIVRHREPEAPRTSRATASRHFAYQCYVMPPAPCCQLQADTLNGSEPAQDATHTQAGGRQVAGAAWLAAHKQKPLTGVRGSRQGHSAKGLTRT